MPAGSDGSGTALPVRFRPLGVRFAAILFGAMLILVTAVVWYAFPQHIRNEFTLFQRGTVLAFGLAAIAAGYALARCRVDARPDGLVTVNGYRTRLYPWDQVSDIFLRPGSPWAMIQLADGSTAAAMGIQGSDGTRAASQVRRLRSIVAEQSRPGESRST